MKRIWECMERGGRALVAGRDRAEAVQACREWLGWRAPAAFSAPEMEQMWRGGGGNEKQPVVLTRDDGQTWAPVTTPACQES